MSAKGIGKILVVDDEVELKNILVEALIMNGYDASGFTSGEEALPVLRTESFDVLLTDLMMPTLDGLSLLREGMAIDPHLVVIVMTGQGTIKTAVDAMRFGAFDYVLKPFRLQTMLPVLTRAMNTRHLRLENLQLRETVAIYELAQTIAFALEPETIISKLADSALQQTDADEVSILLPTGEGGEFYVAAVRGENHQRLLGERVSLESSISGWVARERLPLVLDGEVNDDRFHSLWPHPEIRSAISVPMQVANKVIGTININAINRARPFNLGQMKALTILASTAAAALESSSLYSKVLSAEERYRTIFENAIEGLFQSTADGRFITANPAFARILGYESPAEMIAAINDIGQQLYVQPEARVEGLRILRERGVLVGFEFQAYRKDGEKIWLSENRRSVRDQDGVELYFEGSIEDITERKRSEAELRKSEERYRELVENARDIIYEHDLAGKYTVANKAAEQITGYSVAEILTLNTVQTIAPEFIDKAQQMLMRKLAGETVTAYEIEVIAKDGHRVALDVNSRLVFQNGVPIGVQGIARDVTERKQLEDQLRQSQKLEAVGQLAGGVAHDFNNLLTVIGGYSDLVLRRLPQASPLIANVAEIKKAGDRASGLTRQLLAFSRKQILQPVVLDLNSVVSNLEKMLRRLIGEDIELLTTTEPNLGQVKADPGQVDQVIINLIVNARDAMPEGGKLMIQTANVVLDEEYTHDHVPCLPGSYIMLAVSDTGIGMDAERQARIFEPFFTTKAAGKGTGLGLSTAYGIVKQSGGNIWVYSEVGKGTTFKIYLPRVDEAVDYEGGGGLERMAPHGTETILLVEDEEQVRQIAQQILTTLGYRVLPATNGQEALAVAQEHEGTIDLTITDVVMPQLSGRELVERLCLLRPNMKVLFMSGYTDDAIVRHGLLDERLEFIQKPFAADAFARKIRNVLDLPGNESRVTTRDS